ncbi:hypothetical protein OJ253_3250 [Cryptosporidium canis]|uniref:Uncharacterized protein n=1 Tax=Cryptosporidium canis TaxID=195482 RepID=A0A9D5HUR1_9CRYT|nr:hypothetical protein OJ253_3250 [Cryptosporidium canis]
MQNISGGTVGPQKRVDDLPGQIRVQSIHRRLQNRLPLLPNLIDNGLRDRHLVNQTEERQSRLQNLDHVLLALRPQLVPDHEVRKAVVVHLRHGLQAQDRTHSAQVAVQTVARIVGKEEGDVLGWLVLPKRTLIILSLRSMYGWVTWLERSKGVTSCLLRFGTSSKKTLARFSSSSMLPSETIEMVIKLEL